MATGPEANLWRTMRKNLPEGVFVERIENRHGGGISDTQLVWGAINTGVELKSPASLPAKHIREISPDPYDRTWWSGFLQYARDLNFLPNDQKTRTVIAERILRPAQVSYHSRVNAAGGLSFILAAPKSHKNRLLFIPIRGPAYTKASPKYTEPRSEALRPPAAASGEALRPPAAASGEALRPPAAASGEALRLVDGPGLELLLVCETPSWPVMFQALRLCALAHLRAALACEEGAP